MIIHVLMHTRNFEVQEGLDVVNNTLSTPVTTSPPVPASPPATIPTPTSIWKSGVGMLYCTYETRHVRSI
jgi:hypothetical protein